MIDTEEQNRLFELIANYLEKDVSCIAIGGTAMMFLGYKNTTKDIDLVFSSRKDMEVFAKAIEKLGYRRKSLAGIYSSEKARMKNRPRIYSRGDERFDLFAGDVFGFKLELGKGFVQRNDFIRKSEFKVYILPEEYIILLKSLTDRERDYEDIKEIVKRKGIDWDLVVEEAISQKNRWILIDLERTMKKLGEITFIKSKYFDKLYKATD